MLPMQACASHTGPQGCFVHHWNVCVEHCLQLHPIHTMHTRPIHEVPAYAHWPNSHVPHGCCTIMCSPCTFPSTFCQFSRTQALPRMFRIRSHRRIWTQSPTLSPTSWSDPASTLAPEALLLGGWHTHWRPTTPLQLPPATFRSHTHAHLHLWPDHAAFGPTHPSLPFQHPGQFGPPLAPKVIFLVGWCTH